MKAAMRRSSRRRAGGRCEYCHLPQDFSDLSFHVEHVIPRQHGGTGVPKNLALACPECNLNKGPNLTAIDPNTREIVRLFHPRRDEWARHFAYAGHRLVGKTAVGRATVILLKMNDPARLRVRSFLISIAELR